MRHGTVVKAYSSYYYVQSEEQLIECKVRGKMKLERYSLLVGDEVEFTISGPGKGIIQEIMARKSLLQRPMVANVDQVVLTFAAASPDLDFRLVDRFLVVAELSQMDIVLCINKIDLVNRMELEEEVGRYKQIGYPVLLVCGDTGEGVEDLRSRLYDRVTVFSGPSGVGKSTLLNWIQPGLNLQTGIVSAKIGRGKHTTRYAELIPLEGSGFIVDTPGFSLTEFQQMNQHDLMYCFPEFLEWISRCRFNSCLHDREPQCEIKAAIDQGKILMARYESYCDILHEIQSKKKG